MNDTNILIQDLIDAQHELLLATEAKREAELLAIRKSEEAISKHNDAIAAAVSAKESNEKIISSLMSLVSSVELILARTTPLELLLQRVDIIIVILQSLIQVMSGLHGVDDAQLQRLQDHILKLTELSSGRPFTIDSEQVNIGSDVKGEQHRGNKH